MNRIISSFFLATSLICMGSSAIAEVRVATIDMNRVLNASNEAKTAKTSLETATAKAKKLIDDKKEALAPLEEKARTGKLDPQSKEADQLRKQTREIITLIREKEDEIKKDFEKSNRSITKKTSELVESYAKDNNINLVLDKSSGVRSPVLYGIDSFDISDEIIKKINN